MFEVTTNTATLKTMLDCYRQTGAWLDGSILPQHEREKTKGYLRRRASFFSPALYTYLINTLDVIFAHTPTRVNQDAIYDAFTYDAGSGLTLSQMIKRAAKMAEVQGSAWLVMDTFADQPMNMNGMLQARTYPFLELIEAHSVRSLAVDKLGRVIYFAYGYTDIDETGEAVERVKVITPGRAEILDLDGAFISGVDLPNSLMPVIPVVPSGEVLKSFELPASPTTGLYQGQFGIATTYSLVDESLYAQQFSILNVVTKDDIKNVTLGTSNVLKLSEGSSASFISPAGTPVDLMMKRIESAVMMMIKTFANMITNGDAQSGTAKVIDRQVGAIMLKDMAAYMESVEYKIYETFCAFLRKQPNPDYTVTYFKDFDLGDIGTYIGQAAEMLQLPISDRAKQEIKIDVLKKFFAGTDQVELSEIIVAEGMNTEPTTVDQVDPQPAEEEVIDDNSAAE